MVTLIGSTSRRAVSVAKSVLTGACARAAAANRPSPTRLITMRMGPSLLGRGKLSASRMQVGRDSPYRREGLRVSDRLRGLGGSCPLAAPEPVGTVKLGRPCGRPDPAASPP